MKIQKIQLKNFKCYGGFETELVPGINTISGRNATGKTSIADAIAWCFFGTDCLGNSNPPVRRDGADADVSVKITTDEGVFGKFQSRTKKGDGYADSNTFSIDGLKVSKAEFEGRFTKLKYAMLPGAFLTLPQDRMRHELFNKFCANAVGTVDLAKVEKLGELAEELAHGSLEQIGESNRKIASAAKREIAATAAKIDELERLIMEREQLPYADLELEKAELLKAADSLSSPCPICGAEASPEAKECLERLAEIEKELAKADVSAEEARVSALRTIRKELVEKQTAADKLVYQAEWLDGLISKTWGYKVNEPFGYVKWEFSSANKSGTAKSACIPTVNGRNILDGSANKAARLTGKIDICLAFGGGECPVIIDDAESLDRETLTEILEGLTNQVILLKVTNEKKLNIKKGI